MPRPKTYKCRTEAQRMVRQLVLSMTPENRKAFHEGLRVVTVDHVASKLEEAFSAGSNGGLLSKE